ncbi:MAG TPA: cohesin domain-containing protein, partial [Planctomycetota bacterium]|nr:cohesin domain-containing protein [Planctomycetota bacterium]
RSVVPQLYSGTLTVLEEVTGGACDPERDYGIETNVAIEFELEGGSANPGEEVAVPLTVRTSDRARTHGIQLSVDFDESVLEIVRVDTVHPRPDGQPWNSVLSSLNNDDETPGSAGVDEGYIAGRFIYGSYYGSDILSFPIDAEFTALDLIFRVKENAPVGTTEIRFIDGGIGCFATCEHMVPYRNGMYSAGTSLTPEVVDSFLFINGLLNIVGEVTVFIRGDSNGDHRVDLSDAVFTLGYLFLGKETPGCLDAVDANDDGNLDLSDAVSTLEFLFSGATPLPAPSSSFGVDPTPDSLGCRGSSF